MNVFRLIALVFLLCSTFTATASGQPAWRYRDYDILGSNVYPHPSLPIGDADFVVYNTRVLSGEKVMLAGDVNGDGRPEICMSFSPTQSIYILDPDLEVLNVIKIGFSCYITLLEDVDGDGVLDIGVGTGGTGPNVKVFFYNFAGDVLLELEERNSGQTSFSPFCVLPDGDLIANLYSGYSCLPRGLVRYDLETKKRKWYYEVGPRGGIVSAADVGDDGILEFSLHTNAVSNGAVGKGGPFGGTSTYDNYCYTIVVDENGAERYTFQETAGGFGEFESRFITIRDDQPYKLLCFTIFMFKSEPYRLSKILIRDAHKGGIESVFYGKTNWAFSALACDLDADGEKEVVATNYDMAEFTSPRFRAISYVLDEGLRVLKHSNDIPGKINCANDLNGDGRMEFVLHNSRELFITDDNFNLLWSFDLGFHIWDIIIIDADLDGYNEIYVGTTHGLTAIKLTTAK